MNDYNHVVVIILTINKNKLGMNPLLKNCRTGYHDDILHRTSHYNKLLRSKPSIMNKQGHNYISLFNHPYKK